MAAQLTQRWTQSIWGQAARLVASPPDWAENPPVERRRVRQKQRRLSAEQMDQVVADYVSGMSTVTVGKKYGIDPQTVMNNARARGVKTRSYAPPVMTGVTLDEAVRLRSEGWTLMALGKHFGVSHTTVINALKQAGQA